MGIKLKKKGFCNLLAFAVLICGAAACGNESKEPETNVVSESVVEDKGNTVSMENSEWKIYADGEIDAENSGIVMCHGNSEDGSGNGNFEAKNSAIGVSEKSEAYGTLPLFYVTNTNAEIRLTNTTLDFGSGILLKSAGNKGQWGKRGENGGSVRLSAVNQQLAGSIITDKISSAAVSLENSTYEGSINEANTGDVSVLMDKDSVWTVTGDSYLTVLTNEDKACSNIISGGYMVYYDSANSANDWLGGKQTKLSGGGKLVPLTEK